MTSDPILTMIADHEFAIHTWPLERVHLMAQRGYIDLDPFGTRRYGFDAPVADLIRRSLGGQALGMQIVLNDRMPYTDESDPHERRYALIDGAHILAAAGKWFDDRVHVPSAWFEPGDVGCSIDMSTTQGKEDLRTKHTWLTETGRQRIREGLQASVAIGRLESVDSERHAYMWLNTPPPHAR